MNIKNGYDRWLANATVDADVVAELKTLDVHTFGACTVSSVQAPNVYIVTKASQGLDDLPKSDVLKFLLEDNYSIVVHLSGTEPKFKT